MSRLAELAELEKACACLSAQNRQYVLAVANALKFTEEKNKQPITNRDLKKGEENGDDTS